MQIDRTPYEPTVNEFGAGGAELLIHDVTGELYTLKANGKVRNVSETTADQATFAPSGIGVSSTTTVEAELRRLYALQNDVGVTLTAPTDFGWTPTVKPQYGGPRRWRGHIGVRSLRPALGSVAYYVDGVHGATSTGDGLEVTITAISKANPAVVTYSGAVHPTNGNKVYLQVSGMTEVNSLYFVVANVNTGAGTFELSGINSSAYSTFTSGTFIEPLKKVATAIGKADATVIYVAPHEYNRDDSWANANPATSSSTLVILPWLIRRGTPVLSMKWTHTAATWTNDLTDTLTWTATRSVVAAVRDYSRVNSRGEAMKYEKVNTSTECNSKRGTWFLSAANLLYIHTLRDGAPDDNIAVFLTETGCNYVSTKTIYIEGMEFHGGTSAFIATDSSGGGTGTLYLKDCKARYAINGNGFQGSGVTAIAENCEGMFNVNDGFNWRASNGVEATVIEINCVGAYNGDVRSSSGNGSSAHDGSTILRIGGDYHHNCGPSVVDIQGGKTWCVGSSAHDSMAFQEANRSDYFMQASGGKMWLYDCIADGSPISLVADDSAVIYYDRFAYNGTFQQSTGGTVQTYTQT